MELTTDTLVCTVGNNIKTASKASVGIWRKAEKMRMKQVVAAALVDSVGLSVSIGLSVTRSVGLSIDSLTEPDR